MSDNSEQTRAMARAERLLNGRWVITAGWLGGVPLPDVAFHDLTLRLHDGSFALGVDHGRFTIDVANSPATMDVLIVRGPNSGRFIPAIFEQLDSRLRICFDLSGRDRPTAFAAPAGTRRFLATYSRAIPTPRDAVLASRDGACLSPPPPQRCRGVE
jgi:uncharacterized protein (TIGR03067 family)